MKDWIENNLEQLKAFPQNTGMVVGIFRDGGQSIYTFGRMDSSDVQPPQASTIFEIGSVSKVFTTSLLSLFLINGLLNLDDPVCEIAPELTNLAPDITLLRLATHTSGLPKMPSNIFRSMLRDRGNPYAAYSTSDLLGYLSNTHFKRRSGEQINYSNLGMGLLGHLLERASGIPFEEALIDKICDPLKLQDTRITLSVEQRSRLALPHTSNGKLSHNWDMPAFAGAGGLRATLEDLLKFLVANVMDDGSSMSAAMQTCHEVRTRAFPQMGLYKRATGRILNVSSLPDSYRQGMALGWYVGQLLTGDYDVHWHHGATGGYRSFVGFSKATNTGVALLTNSGPSMVDGFFSTTTTDHLGFRILEYIHKPE